MTNLKKISEEYKSEVGDRVFNFTFGTERDEGEVTVMFREKDDHCKWTTVICGESVSTFLDTVKAMNDFAKKIEELALEEKE